MGSWLLVAVLVGAFVTLNVVGLIVNRRIGRSPSPRAARKRYRWIILNQVVSGGMVACLLFFQGAIEWKMALLLGVTVVGMVPLAWLLMKRQTEDESQRNFAHDTRCCGRCEYDLTGNLSGVCPECGWGIPKTPMRLQDPKWACWWREWEIEYLENWPRALWMVRLNVVMFSALAVGMLVWLGVYASESLWFPVLLSLPMWLIAGHMLILSVRIAAYGRRQGDAPGLGREARGLQEANTPGEVSR
jgi:hypothetical protein